ncbi:4Fe-4S dicluster domain-containing protein [uncultured Oscillibacter sp.]|uniref:4Fe-4S dicluster domain-containing protein n=1 Tax=uncultured Oscillibacter sp. TaxID=876091 RepID=UPI002805202F|nr:4Fe-4S dicluster domain-containing protein [uncultured Oscillibacter sp.]
MKTCIGCGACAEACPSGAISMVPLAYPPQQKKAGAVVAAANHLAECKAGEEQAAHQAAAAAGQDGLRRP